MQNTQGIVGRSESVSHDQIAALARTFWEQEGRPTGRELDHWFKAEAQLFTTNKTLMPMQSPVEKAAEKSTSSKKRTRSVASK